MLRKLSKSINSCWEQWLVVPPTVIIGKEILAVNADCMNSEIKKESPWPLHQSC